MENIDNFILTLESVKNLNSNLDNLAVECKCGKEDCPECAKDNKAKVIHEDDDSELTMAKDILKKMVNGDSDSFKNLPENEQTALTAIAKSLGL